MRIFPPMLQRVKIISCEKCYAYSYCIRNSIAKMNDCVMIRVIRETSAYKDNIIRYC